RILCALLCSVLYSSRPPPHLHPFPTRRSSDLDGLAAYTFGVAARSSGGASASVSRYIAFWSRTRGSSWRIAAYAEVGSAPPATRSEEHTSELQSQSNLVCRLLLEKKKKTDRQQ